MMTLEEVWENLRQDPETKATMEEVDKSYKLFKKIENLIVADLETKLEEKTRVAEGYSELFDKKQHENYQQFCEIQELKKQLAEKEKALHTANQETLHFQNKYFAEKQIAVEELDKVKVKLLDSFANVGLNTYCEKVKPVENYIDQQINELKGEK